MTSEERTHHVEDDEIRAVVEHYDDPEHPDALDVPEVRALLADVQRAVESRWEGHLQEVRRGDVEVLRDTGSVVVVQDHRRLAWSRLLDEIGLTDRVDRTVVRMSHYQAAGRILDREFDGADPLLVRKPEDARAGQRFTEAVVNGLLGAGLSPTEAWAYYGVGIRDYGLREWTDRCGYDDRATVADAVETAADGLDE